MAMSVIPHAPLIAATTAPINAIAKLAAIAIASQNRIMARLFITGSRQLDGLPKLSTEFHE